MSVARHIFSARPDATHRSERAEFWIFRIATYFILACGATIFLHIVFKGSTMVFKAEPPFLNTTFLTAAPESLYIFDWEGRKLEMGDLEFRAFKAANPGAASVKTESYVYSAGGIWPCIVGTVLLVVGSMSIALVLGVCAAI